MTLQQYVDSIRDKRIAVLGIGVSNTPLIELLCRNGCDVTACDKRSMEQMGEEGERLLSLGARLKLGEDYLENLDRYLRTIASYRFNRDYEKYLERSSNVR